MTAHTSQHEQDSCFSDFAGFSFHSFSMTHSATQHQHASLLPSTSTPLCFPAPARLSASKHQHSSLLPSFSTPLCFPASARLSASQLQHASLLPSFPASARLSIAAREQHIPRSQPCCGIKKMGKFFAMLLLRIYFHACGFRF